MDGQQVGVSKGFVIGSLGIGYKWPTGGSIKRICRRVIRDRV